MDAAARFDRRMLVEQAVDARELEVSVLGNDEPIASVAGEIVPCNEFYDYDAKYVDDRSELIIPAEIEGKDADLPAGAGDRRLPRPRPGRDGAGRFLPGPRRPTRSTVNEVNTIPGFTAISMYPMLWEASGIPLPELVDRLIALALERHADRRR